MNLQSLGGRRFILTMLTGATVSLLVYFGKIDSATYFLVTISTVGAYITANVYESIKTPT